MAKWCLTFKCIQSRGVIEFLHVETIAPIDILQCLLNVYGDQTVDVRDWPHSRWLCTAISCLEFPGAQTNHQL
jgi:hypothetical protein